MLVVLCCATALLSAQLQPASQGSSPTAKQPIPVMDGGAGPCAIELTVLDPSGKPVYAATIDVHIEYGFAGVRRLDLEAGTNSDGKVKFTGLPARVHRPPLEFRAKRDDLQGVATYDPTDECQAHHDISLAKPSSPAGG
jgi:hypothetical protein